MLKSKYILMLVLFELMVVYVQAQTELTYNNPVSTMSLPDPTLVRGTDGAFYLFATEDTRNVPVMKSMNLVDWTMIGTVFTNETRPNFVPNGGIWAPDVSYVNGKYVLYYSMSTWGGEWQCGIGRAVADKPQGPYTNLGKLFISSEIGVQNSIDPFFIEDNGRKFLIWGSFRGIYAIELTDDGLNMKPDQTPVKVLGTAFEGVYIHKKDNYYYAFASVGSCCDGINSTYRTVVGRSQNLLGPYVDKSGRPMLDNNYEVVINKSVRFIGTGHNSEIVKDDMGLDWILYHAIDYTNPSGRKLMLDQIHWDAAGWPYVNNGMPSRSYTKPTFLPKSTSNLTGFQKLRGIILSSPAEDEYTSHAYNAFDTNEGTNFKARDMNGWIGLDLKSKQIIKKVRVYPNPDKPERLNGSIIQGSGNADFSSPTNLYSINETPQVGFYTTYDIVSNQEFQYVRIISPNQNCNLAELEFYCDSAKQDVEYPQLTNNPTIYIETKGAFNFVDKEEYVTANVIISKADSIRSYPASVRGRGNSTWDFMEKKPFRLKFDNKQNFLGMPAYAKSWTLIACAVDKTLLRNSLAFEMSRVMGFEFTPSNVIVDVVLDGYYYGAYMASDHIEVDANRINVVEMAATDITLPEISGGYHLEIDAYAEQEPVYFKTNTNVPITIKSPKDDVIVPLQKDWIKNYINTLETLLLQDAEAAISRYIDLESAVRYYLHSELTGNCDSYWCVPCYKKRGDDKLYFGPVWDYDQAFLTNERVPLKTATLDTQHGVVQHWFRAIMKTESAQVQLKVLWKKVQDEGLKDQLIQYLTENAARIQLSQALNYERWRSLNRKVWFEYALFPTYNQYIDFVSQFIEARFAWFEETYMTEKKHVLPASTPGNPLQSWQYTTDTPSPDWNKSTFDDSGWRTGKAPFGTFNNLQNTLWTTNQIYIRTKFYVSPEDLNTLNKTYFYTLYDEDCWVYLNDQLALQRGGYLTSYQSFEFDKSLLKAGWNTLAVKCIQTAGGQLIDVGVYGSVKTSTDVKFSEKPTKYSWFVRNGMVTVRNVDGKTTVKLYGIDGKLIKETQAYSGEIQFQLPYRGVYLIQLQGETIKVIN